MLSTASLPADQFSDLLRRLPPDLDFNARAFETKAIERRREIRDGVSLLRLALSLSQTAAWASMIGLTDLSSSGVKYRGDKVADFLKAVLEQLLATTVPGAQLRWPGPILRAADGNSLSRHGSKGTDWRVHGVTSVCRS